MNPENNGNIVVETYTLDDYIACVDREIALRKAFYPKLIERGKMTKEEAQKEISKMEDIAIILTRIKFYDCPTCGFGIDAKDLLK